MTRPKRKKSGVLSPLSEDSLNLETDVLGRLERLEQKIEVTSTTSTQKLLDQIEKLQDSLHDLIIENESIKKELKNLKEERSVLEDEVQQLRELSNVLKERQNEAD